MKDLGLFLLFITSVPTWYCIFMPIMGLIGPAGNNLIVALFYALIIFLAGLFSSFVATMQMVLIATLLPRRTAKVLGVDSFRWRSKS